MACSSGIGAFLAKILHQPPLDWSRPTPSSAPCCPGPASCTWTLTCGASRGTIVSLVLTALFLFTVVMTFCLCCACSVWWLMPFVLASDHYSPWLVASLSPCRIFRSCCRHLAASSLPELGPLSSDCLPEALPCRPCLPLAPSASPPDSLATAAAAGSEDALESLSSESSDSSAEEATVPDEPAMIPTPKAVSPPPSASVASCGHANRALGSPLQVLPCGRGDCLAPSSMRCAHAPTGPRQFLSGSSGRCHPLHPH